MTVQWLRACSLIVADMSGDGVELAGGNLQPTGQELRIRFTAEYWIGSTPAMLNARIYNLSIKTIKKLQALASKAAPTESGVPGGTSARIQLKVGYQDELKQLFVGQIYQMRVGYETSTDSYLDIFAADGILAHAYAISEDYLPQGYTKAQEWALHAANMKGWGVDPGPPPDGLDTNKSPRGKVNFGMTADRLDDFGKTNNVFWNVLDQQLIGIPKGSYRSGAKAIRVNHLTGQIGFPEQTAEGVKVECLLNPEIKWGTHIILNNLEVTRLLNNQQSAGTDTGNHTIVDNAKQYLVTGNPLNPTFVPPLAEGTDGEYVVLWSEHVGDTRGNEWLTKFICLAADPTSPAPKANRLAPPFRF